MPTKNESLWLASGQAGENQARALNLPITFSKLVVGDANGAYPPMDSAITALVNERLEGAILSHEVDPNDVNQRIIQMDIPPTLDFDAVELLLFAKYGETEFAHTYFRLAAPYPVRTVGNGGSQVKLKYTIRVNQDTDVSVFVSPNLSYVTNDQLKDDLKPIEVNASRDAIIDKNRLHIFTGFSDLQIPDDVGTAFRFLVDDSVELGGVNKCRLLAPSFLYTGKDKILADKTETDTYEIKETGIIYNALNIDGIWKIIGEEETYLGAIPAVNAQTYLVNTRYFLSESISSGKFPSNPNDGDWVTLIRHLGNLISPVISTEDGSVIHFNGAVLESQQLIKSATFTFNGTSWQDEQWFQNDAELARGEQVFTSSGTFNVPTGISEIFVTQVGGGGGGGGGANVALASSYIAQGGAGGGGGGTLLNAIVPVTPGGTASVTVGIGGTAQAADYDTNVFSKTGVSGGYSRVSGLQTVTSYGGSGGTGGTYSTGLLTPKNGGSGGSNISNGTGTLITGGKGGDSGGLFPGTAGMDGVDITTVEESHTGGKKSNASGNGGGSGGGGSSGKGAGGNAGVHNASNGSNGKSYGGGGGGGGGKPAQSGKPNKVGGNGSAGIVIIGWKLP